MQPALDLEAHARILGAQGAQRGLERAAVLQVRKRKSISASARSGTTLGRMPPRIDAHVRGDAALEVRERADLQARRASSRIALAPRARSAPACEARPRAREHERARALPRGLHRASRPGGLEVEHGGRGLISASITRRYGPQSTSSSGVKKTVTGGSAPARGQRPQRVEDDHQAAPSCRTSRGR